MRKDLIRVSKFLSLVLRHKPEKIGITLDDAGWVEVATLLAACHQQGLQITPELLDEVVSSNDKKRFAFSEDGLKIRASQGHSIAVELDYQPLTPPELLYHGTATRFLDSIKERGLLKGSRHHVHLSADETTAIKVGARHGKPVVLIIEAARMQERGFLFYQSANGVWLTEHIAPEYIRF
ncbi:MAG: RNA 2'-phosphotransferase [Acidobacteriota bacterium]